MVARYAESFRQAVLSVCVVCAVGIAGLPAAADDMEFTASVWADNWFAFYVNGELVVEDIVPVTEIRSFNSQTFTFRASYPFDIAVVTKDYVENDSGLEYIGSFFGLFYVGEFFTPFQQIGDGGFIAQIAETRSGDVVATTSSDWRGLVVHQAPLNPDCEKSRQPLVDCKFKVSAEPTGWKDADFDDTGWAAATEYTAEQIGARFGYNDIEWDRSAKLIWSADIETDNIILWRYRVTP
ncbi:PEBP family protein [Pyruvatibacter sp.]|uniref:PEBP family protein n=1 Tax=Pyruvatibacter sp. TaxID=1981328 RepID=UPI0032EC052A